MSEVQHAIQAFQDTGADIYALTMEHLFNGTSRDGGLYIKDAAVQSIRVSDVLWNGIPSLPS